jgi:hypothetical protein
MYINFLTKPRLLDIGFHDGHYILGEVTGNRLRNVQVLHRFDTLLAECRRATIISADDVTKQRLERFSDIAAKLL